jgi:hypothetical protein
MPEIPVLGRQKQEFLAVLDYTARPCLKKKKKKKAVFRSSH